MRSSCKIVIKKANGAFASVVIGVWLIPWAAITATILYGVLFDNNGRTDDYLTILTPLAIVGLIGIRQFLWNLRGRDEIEFLATKIRLSRRGSFLHRPITELPYTSFYGFKLGDFNNTPKWVALWGLGGNRIVARCGSFNRMIGQGLSKAEALRLVSLLNERIQIVKHHNG